ncbi:hypothetical protein HCY52_08110 [Acinetobacter radioresistens]|uniref:hypothetical protein n=1 Tax=Acinetobacter radioresistens TaxID=40216 RepID=UPI002003B1FF|nr:hypothetical protein [Acinetobacter radioresistens]MCK4083778.1 hypothetical protein [Acinetobacter radioresistens]
MTKLKNNKLVMAFNDYMPDSIIGRVSKIGLLMFAFAVPVYIYQSYVSDTPKILKTPCVQAEGLTPANQQRIKELVTYAGGKDTAPVCTLLPIPSTKVDLSEMQGLKQLINYPIPLLGSIYYYLASNILIFVSLSFLFVVIVYEKYPVLGRSFPRQFLTASTVFLIATNVFIPTVESVQYATMSQNAVSKNRLAVDNRMLCDTEHVFDLLKYQNAIPSIRNGYQLVTLDNKPFNAIVCHGTKLKVFENIPLPKTQSFWGHIAQFVVNILTFLPIPLFLVLFLNLYKRLIHRIINR